ncbi:MAG: hypothetical protein AAB554_03360, partial [Patescibacteria group bacterium]
TLDDVVLKVDKDLPLAEDIHPAIHKVGEYAADMVRLPAALAKLEAQKASAEASVPARDKAVRQARHAVAMLAAKLKKLGESIDRNRLAASNEDTKTVSRTAAYLVPNLPASRQDIVDSLRKEMLAAEDDLAKAKAAAKKAESNRKGVATRAANLTKKIGEARKAVTDHEKRLEETIKLLRKTVNHLRNRQEKRDNKRKACAHKAPPAVEESSKGPTDDDIRWMAEVHGLTIECPADLEAARQLFA